MRGAFERNSKLAAALEKGGGGLFGFEKKEGWKGEQKNTRRGKGVYRKYTEGQNWSRRRREKRRDLREEWKGDVCNGNLFMRNTSYWKRTIFLFLLYYFFLGVFSS